MNNAAETTTSQDQSEPVIPSDNSPSTTSLLDSETQNPMERLSDGILKLAPAFLTLLAFWLAVQGQSFFDLEPIEPFNLRNGMIRFGLATLFLLLATFLYRLPTSFGRTLQQPPESLANLEPLTELFSPRRVVITMLGLLLIVNILMGLAEIDPRNPQVSSFAGYFWGWVLASALVAGAWLTPLPNLRQIPANLIRWWRTSRWEVLGIMLITLLAAWLRLNDLANAPFTINGDEGSIGLDVLHVLKGELKNPFTLAWGPLPSLHAFVLAQPMQLFGHGIFSLRVVSALDGTFAVVALFVLTRLMTCPLIALVAALFLATFPMHLHYSRVAVGGGIWDCFFFTATFAAFWWGMHSERRGTWPFVLAGLLAGLDQYAYTGSRLLPITLLWFVIFLTLFYNQKISQKLFGVLIMGLVFAVVAGPIYLHAYRFPDDFNARINQIGIIQNGWLKAEAERRDESRALILWDQFQHTLFGFAYFHDQTETWGPGTPLAPTLFSIGLFLGLIVSLRHWREPAIVLMHGWFWSFILTGGMLTLEPPTSNRLVGLTPVVCFFAALGWHAVAQTLAPAFASGQKELQQAHLGFLLLLASFTGYTGVRAQQEYLADNEYGGGNARVATHIGYELATYPLETSLIMLGAPRIFSDISPLLFLTPNYARQDIVEPLTAPPTSLPPDGDLMIVVLPERAGEIAFIQQSFPNGKLREVYDQNKNELIYYEIMVER